MNIFSVWQRSAKVGILLATIFLVSCEKPRRFPIEPYLEYRSHEVVPATANRPFPALEINMYFRDGDGDIGLEPGDTLAPFCTTCDYFNNLFITVYSKVNGDYVFPFDEPSRIRNLTPVGQNKTLEGTIQYRINLNNVSSDTVRVEVQLVDRALNKSNIETLEDIYVGGS
jgi:hypothetical protein